MAQVMTPQPKEKDAPKRRFRFRVTIRSYSQRTKVTSSKVIHLIRGERKKY
jgi:hypothetical protein